MLIVAVALLMIGIAAIDTYDPQYTAPKTIPIFSRTTPPSTLCAAAQHHARHYEMRHSMLRNDSSHQNGSEE